MNRRLSALLGALTVVRLAGASTLTFVPQEDILPGTTNYSWFSAANWFAADLDGTLVAAGRVPQANDSAIVTSLADAGITGVRVQGLVLTNNAALSNGTFSVQNLQMLSGSTLDNTTVNILVFLNVGGTNCTLNTAVLNLLSIASGTLTPIAPAPAASLILAQGSALNVYGPLNLTDGSSIFGGPLPQSIVTISPGGILSSANLVHVLGSAAGHLKIDNSGLVRCDGGNLTFDNGIDWLCTLGTGEFRATTMSALISFGSGFHADAGTTSLFTGPGTNLWLSGSSIDGTGQVGALDPNTLDFSTGNLEIRDSCSGSGDLHILGSPTQTAVLNWNNGTLSLGAVNVDTNGTMLLTGGNGSNRQLLGCAINNSGLCSVLKGDLTFGAGATVNNLAGGMFELLADGAFFGSPAPAGGAVNNFGTFRQSSPGVSQFGTGSPAQGPDFNNAGLVDVVNGQLNLMGGLSSGQFQTEAGAVLWFWGGTHTLEAGASFIGPGSVRLAQGLAAPQWVVAGGVSVAELELGVNGLVIGLTNPTGVPIAFGTLVADGNGTLSNGTYSVQSAQMLGGSALVDCTMNILGSLLFGGTNCLLDGAAVNILSGATGSMVPVAPASASTVDLTRGAALRTFGLLSLSGGSQIVGGALPQSALEVRPGGVLSSTNMTRILGSASGPLLFDNSGLVRFDSGTLRFDNGIAWRSTAGSGEFRAAFPDSQSVFATGFHADLGTLTRFTGPGTNIWSAASSINGTVQIGSLDPNTQVFTTGNLAVMAACSGQGSVHVLGSSAQLASLNWNNGTLGLSTITIDTNGLLLITGGAGTSRQLSGCTINNWGVCKLLAGDLSLGQGASINNRASGVFQVLADAAFSGVPAPAGGAFNNEGTFRKNSPNITQFGTTDSMQGPDFNNAGLVDIVSGQFNLMGGTSAGRFQAGAGATLWFWGGSHTLNAGANFVGAGSIRLYQGLSAPQWLVNGAVYAYELELGTNGTIAGPGALAIASDLFWTNGTIQNAGSLNISPGARMSVMGPLSKTWSQRTVNNQGSVLFQNQAAVTCGAGATLNNLAAGTVDIQTDATIAFDNLGQRLGIINAGNFMKSGGAGLSGVDAIFNNAGNLEVKVGTLNFQSSWAQTQGSTTIDLGAVLAGTLLTVQGGSLAGMGTIQANVVNGGLTSPGGSPGVLSLGSGNDYQQLAGGILRSEVGGHVAGTQYDQLVVGGNASLAGVLELQIINGFTPKPGDSFLVLTCGTQAGKFAQVSAPQISGAVWVPHYTGNGVSVVLADQVTLAPPTLSGGELSFSFKTTPGLSYIVQRSSTLNPANWQTLTTLSGDGTTLSVSDPANEGRQFYRVLIQ
jgi:hypothetical protein